MKPILRSLVLLGAVAVLASCQDEHESGPPTPRPVLSVVVTPHETARMEFAGTVEARYESDLGFQVLGRVVSRDVSVGEVVAKGQLLAALDPVAYKLAVHSARAALARANARLVNATASEARQQALFVRYVASQAQVDLAEQELEAARADVSRAEADLVKAEEQLGYTLLRAEFDGYVTAVAVEPGQVVHPGQTVVAVARPETREAVVDLPESVGRDLKPRARFEIVLQHDRKVRAVGWVREVAPQADPSTRTRRVRLTLDDPPESFRLGTTITAMIESPDAPGVDLPRSALLERGGRTMVWVMDPDAGTVSTEDVTVVAQDGATVRVLGDLRPGSRIITAGANSLEAGQTVKIPAEALP